MTYQIDQSGKIEQTNRLTVVTLANGQPLTIKISSIEKQKLIRTIINLDRPKKNYSYKIFVALIIILLKKKNLNTLTIDTEYLRHEADIKDMLIQWGKREKIKIPHITFTQIGKDNPAHLAGISVYRNHSKANIIVRAEDLLKITHGWKSGIKPKKVGRRSRSSRDNP